MTLFAVFFLVCVSVFVAGQECDEKGVLLYEDLGCKPDYGTDKKCPKKFTCVGLEPWTKNCYFRGKTYEDSEEVASELSYPSCDIGCRCKGNRFVCAVLDCPEWLGATIGPRCHRKYEPKKCCSVGQVCRKRRVEILKESSIRVLAPFTDVHKCTVEGKVYLEGQKFYPSNTCLECVCQKGFQGKFEESFCARASCGQQLKNSRNSKLQNSCAPFYSKSRHSSVLCCPDNYICPDESETIQGVIRTGDTCKFGQRFLRVGQYVEKLNVRDDFGRQFSKIRCECVLPPLLTCTDQ